MQLRRATRRANHRGGATSQPGSDGVGGAASRTRRAAAPAADEGRRAGHRRRHGPWASRRGRGEARDGRRGPRAARRPRGDALARAARRVRARDRDGFRRTRRPALRARRGGRRRRAPRRRDRQRRAAPPRRGGGKTTSSARDRARARPFSAASGWRGGRGPRWAARVGDPRPGGAAEGIAPAHEAPFAIFAGPRVAGFAAFPSVLSTERGPEGVSKTS